MTHSGDNSDDAEGKGEESFPSGPRAPRPSWLDGVEESNAGNEIQPEDSEPPSDAGGDTGDSDSTPENAEEDDSAVVSSDGEASPPEKRRSSHRDPAGADDAIEGSGSSAPKSEKERSRPGQYLIEVGMAVWISAGLLEYLPLSIETGLLDTELAAGTGILGGGIGLVLARIQSPRWLVNFALLGLACGVFFGALGGELEISMTSIAVLAVTAGIILGELG